MKIDGHSISREIIEDLKKQEKPEKIFAAILIGDGPRSASFLRQKEQVAKEVGIDFRLYNLSAELGNDGLRQEVRRLVEKKSVGGAIIQLPLPKGLNSHYVLNAIPREKDIDVLTERALGAFYNDRNPVLPPAVATVKTILDRVSFDLEKAEVAVVGLGTLVGKPVSVWLIGKCKNLFLLRKGSDLELLKRADLIVTGVGQAGLIKQDMLKPGAGIIDFGYYYFPEGAVSGDFDSTSLAIGNLPLAFSTPTPGGTGPILVAELFHNFYILNSQEK